MNAHCLAQRRHAQARGFTLIELMIVVAIVAIIAAVALPNYFGSVRKSRRADAITALNQITQAQERWRANQPQYAQNAMTATPADCDTPAEQLANSCLNISNPSSGYYSLSIAGASGTGYVATAAATGAQLKDTKCLGMGIRMAGGNMTYVSSLSTVHATIAASTTDANRCWNR